MSQLSPRKIRQKWCSLKDIQKGITTLMIWSHITENKNMALTVRTYKNMGVAMTVTTNDIKVTLGDIRRV